MTATTHDVLAASKRDPGAERHNGIVSALLTKARLGARIEQRDDGVYLVEQLPDVPRYKTLDGMSGPVQVRDGVEPGALYETRLDTRADGANPPWRQALAILAEKNS